MLRSPISGNLRDRLRRVGEFTFGVELLQYEALDDEATYRFNFLPTEPNATLLSLERA